MTANFRRPAQVPRWAWDASADLVQPPAGSAKMGFGAQEEPPAQWFNWVWNAHGAWIDFLRGPGVERWTRNAWSGSPASFDAPSLPSIPVVAWDVDATTEDTGGAAYRYAVVGTETGPAYTMYVSQRGNAWTRRTLPGTVVDSPTALAVAGSRWVLGDGAGVIHHGVVDDGTGVGPMAGGTAFAAASLPGTLAAIKAFAAGSSRVFCLTNDAGVYSDDDGQNWSAYSVSGTARSGDGTSAVWDGNYYVFCTATGQVYNSAEGAAFAYKSTLGAATKWRLAAGDSGEVVAWRRNESTAHTLKRSVDSGASWTDITPTQSGATIRITDLKWHGGVWIATSSYAPFLWVSNDLQSWRALRPPVSGSAALYAVAWDGGAWAAVGNGFTLLCDRAADPADGLYVALDVPSTLADAGSLRGLLVSSTAPTNGQVLAWNSGTSRWTPTTIATSSSPTTTRGDIIRRGASADERLALGTSGYVLSSDGTDVVWVKTPGPWETFTSGGVTTTDDTTTTCGATYAPTAGGHFVEIHVRAETSDLATCAAWVVRAHVKNVSSTVTISGSGGGDVSVDGPVGDAVAWTVALDVSGGAVRLRVTGALATTIDWTARWTIR